MRFRIRGVVVSLALLFLCVSCAPEPSSSSEAKTYTVRGMVRQIPDKPNKQLFIRHEAIPDFVDNQGQVVGMESMTMEFPVDAALVEGIAPGDRILFDFRMDWDGSPPMEVVRVEKLSAETRLEFETEAAESEATEEKTDEAETGEAESGGPEDAAAKADEPEAGEAETETDEAETEND